MKFAPMLKGYFSAVSMQTTLEPPDVLDPIDHLRLFDLYLFLQRIPKPDTERLENTNRDSACVQ